MTRFSRPAAILAFVGSLALTAQTSRPMTIRDLIVAVRVADPQVSPNGQSVAFVRTTTDPASGKRNADVWIAPANGEMPAKALFAGDKSETTPRWSPDGRQLVFISTRDGDPQVYYADADGSNVRKITDVSGGVQPPLVFSPDGTMVAFVADVYPDCKDDACNRQRREAADKDPVKAHVITRLLYRHWDEWREGVRHHVFVAPIGLGATHDVTPGDFDSPPGQQEDNAIAFTPNSKLIAFVSNREGNDKEAWTTNNDVWLVPVSR
jgi:Tol biopolymer transport system component